ncbi:methionine ABC transporter ATP-binding protein [Schleiferilactobacillus perolens]|uniref:methionine ABC transporter ATP-binding protein n=1 Tax=Schleiferilactobacillus perolens TaxID=100468 RepID=UPI0023533166|nr:methionine ABC transporter ATP-binding protein [Schleiferilactobacillus perolens]MCI2171196.1 methionine ABC transporter ATP-binding protein [Schleiferilactobacillus perolens]
MSEPIIDLEHITVTFRDKKSTVHAVKDVSLQVERGDVYGIVGYSGAGKSTLVRTMNYLQLPTSGTAVVNGQTLGKLNTSQLRQARRKIGMIFQHFNLMNSRTIADNIDYPLRYSQLTRPQREKKVKDLLHLVGLDDKADAYPAQLSGGQKQRVGIARALANDPKILLCDEATSALDPKTTGEILDLLKQVNQDLGITIVLITHEMAAVKAICHHVAVMEEGEIVERGPLLDIFSKPQKQLTKDFINTAAQLDTAIAEVRRQPAVINLAANAQLLHLSYVGASTDQPLIADLYQQFGITANILYGNVEFLQDTPVGNLIVILSGDISKFPAAFAQLRQEGVTVTVLDPKGDAVA